MSMRLTREQKIYRILETLKRQPMTRHEVVESTGIPLESVCGRVNELLCRGAVEVCGSKLCRETGKEREIIRIKRQGSVAA